MNPKDQFSVLLDLVVELRNSGSWTGETHVQKATYLLQELLGLPTGFEFVLYKHGPFSFELREALERMEAGRLIELEEQRYPYGPKSFKTLSYIDTTCCYVSAKNCVHIQGIGERWGRRLGANCNRTFCDPGPRDCAKQANTKAR